MAKKHCTSADDGQPVVTGDHAFSHVSHSAFQSDDSNKIRLQVISKIKYAIQ
jgi:hypothetical protein